MVVQRRHPQIVAQNDADLPHRCRGSSTQADADSVQADADFPCRRAQSFCVDLG